MVGLKFGTRFFILSVLFVFACTILAYSFLCKEELRLLEVTFFDVGQGDAILIEAPSGTQVLIDGGPDRSVLRELGRKLPFFDRTIDLLIATHPDRDHIGGLVHVLERYEIHTIILTENKSDTPVSQAFLDRIAKEGATIVYARSGQEYLLGEGVRAPLLTVLFPDRDPADLESNTSSIITKLQYGDVGFMLTGDAPDSIETYVGARYGENLESEILKVGHHGSRTSSDATFLSLVDPELAVVSSGKGNSYGHPHKEVVDALTQRGAEIKNTAVEGSISVHSDGVLYWLR